MTIQMIAIMVACGGILIAGGQPAIDLIAITLFAIVAGQFSRKELGVATGMLITSFVMRAAFDYLPDDFLPINFLPDTYLSATTTEDAIRRTRPLHYLVSVFCLVIIFFVNLISSPAPATRPVPTTPLPQSPLGLANLAKASVKGDDPTPVNEDAGELLPPDDSSNLDIVLSAELSELDKVTDGEQRTHFSYPLTSAKTSHLIYDIEPDEVLDELIKRLLPMDLVNNLVNAGIGVPEAVARSANAGETTAKLVDALIRCGTLTRYQAMLICSGSPNLLRVGSYEVLDRIGRGGMAIVLKVRELHTKHIYALKLLADIDGIDDALRNRFLREMEAVRGLAHPNIAVAREVGHHRQLLYIAMEWVQGQNLAQHVYQHGPLSTENALNYIRQAAAALQHAHQRNLVHRDIKPANLILAANGEIKLVDMGLARFIDALEQRQESESKNWRTDSGHLLGTIDYMAPEQALDLSIADHRSDIYSLGCTLFYLLTGQTHLRGKTQRRRALSLVNRVGMRDVREFREELPACAYELICKMMKIDPRDRFQSIAELLAAIDACASEFGMPAALGKSYRVLVVEDSETQSLITCKQLQTTSRHFIPVDVRTLEVACQKLQSDSFDFVLLDLNLPDSFGTDTIVRIRKAHASIPILVLTGNNDPTMGVRCITAGADDYLPKESLDVSTLERHILLTLSRRDVLHHENGKDH